MLNRLSTMWKRNKFEFELFTKGFEIINESKASSSSDGYVYHSDAEKKLDRLEKEIHLHRRQVNTLKIKLSEEERIKNTLINRLSDYETGSTLPVENDNVEKVPAPSEIEIIERIQAQEEIEYSEVSEKILQADGNVGENL